MKHKSQPEADEPETFFSRQQDTLPEEGGRFAKQIQTRIITGGASYPKLPQGPLTTPQPDHGFQPSRDRIDPEDVYSDTFGQALSGKSNPPQEPLLPSAPATHDGEALIPAAALSSFSKPIRRV